MTFLTIEYWGAFSGVPLRISLSSEEVDKLRNDGVITIRATFFIEKGVNVEKRTAEIKKHFLYISDTDYIVEINMDAVFKTAFYSYEKIADTLRGYRVPIEIEASATYREGNEIKELTGVGIVLKEKFNIFPATFSTIKGYIKEGRRVCKDFASRNGEYTTLFRRYPQDCTVTEFIHKGGDDYEVEYKSIDLENYKYIDRVIDDCGIFIAWRNAAGTISHWLFSSEYTEEIKTKQLGQIVRGRRIGYGDKLSLLHSLGSTAVKRWTLKSNIPVMEGELDELQSLLSSSHAYIYREGRDGDLGEWERVVVVEGTHKFDINKQSVHAFGVTIEFEPLRTIREL